MQEDIMISSLRTIIHMMMRIQ